MKFRERIDPKTYAEEEPVGLAVVATTELPGPILDDRWSYIPEPLWQRILSLGAAYSLHFSQIAEPIIDTVLDESQCQSLCDELEFLHALILDPAAGAAIAAVRERALLVARDSSKRLVISPP